MGQFLVASQALLSRWLDRHNSRKKSQNKTANAGAMTRLSGRPRAGCWNPIAISVTSGTASARKWKRIFPSDTRPLLLRSEPRPREAVKESSSHRWTDAQNPKQGIIH
jgi:hypothetical protein